MLKQTVSIDLKYHPNNDFKILNVYRSRQNELIVVSKYSPNYADICLAVVQDLHTKPQQATVSVAKKLPVKHYIIGLPEYYSPELLPTEPYTHIYCQQDVPADEKEACLYENPDTEEQEVERKIEYFQREIVAAKTLLTRGHERQKNGTASSLALEGMIALDNLIKKGSEEIEALQSQLVELKIERDTFRPSWWDSHKGAIFAGALGLFAVGAAAAISNIANADSHTRLNP